MNAETIVKVEGLTKKYDTKAVVDNLSFEIKEGEIFGLDPKKAQKPSNAKSVIFLRSLPSMRI